MQIMPIKIAEFDVLKSVINERLKIDNNNALYLNLLKNEMTLIMYPNNNIQYFFSTNSLGILYANKTGISQRKILNGWIINRPKFLKNFTDPIFIQIRLNKKTIITNLYLSNQEPFKS